MTAYKILIAGGGTAGVAVAARFKKETADLHLTKAGIF